MGRKRGIFSYEEDEWLKEFYPNHTSGETAQEFYKLFGKPISAQSIMTHCNKYLGVVNHNRWFSKEEENWLVNNWGSYKTIDKAYQDYCALFGNQHSLTSITSKVSDLGIKLDKNYWSKEEESWLYENYQRTDLTLKELHQLFCSKFDKKRTFKSFVSKAKKDLGLGKSGRGCFKKGHLNKIGLKRKELGVKKGMVLTDLGNGEFAIVDKRTYKDLNRISGSLGNGELTKATIDLIHVQQKIKDLKREKM